MNTGGPAFPTKNYQSVVPLSTGYREGISVREYFAAKAMQAWLTKYPDDMSDNRAAAGVDTVARFAYAMADAMLSQREKS
jgi:hypothetical protein